MYTIVNFIDPNDEQPTVAIFNEDRSRVSICTSASAAARSVRFEPKLDGAVKDILKSDQQDYIRAVRVALLTEGEPFFTA